MVISLNNGSKLGVGKTRMVELNGWFKALVYVVDWSNSFELIKH